MFWLASVKLIYPSTNNYKMAKIKNKNILALATMEKFLKESGAIRVSTNAKEELKNILENYAKDISARAIKLANHSKRKTVKSVDIKLAIK